MQVNVDTANNSGGTTHIFGATEPQPGEGDNGSLRVWMLGRPSDGLPSEIDIEGEVTRTVDEAAWAGGVGDMIDHMLNILADPEAKVIVQENPHYNTALETAHKIRSEYDVDGELVIRESEE